MTPEHKPSRTAGASKTQRNHARPDQSGAIDALSCLCFESTVVALAALDLKSGKTLSDEQKDRLELAVYRIRYASEAAHESLAKAMGVNHA